MKPFVVRGPQTGEVGIVVSIPHTGTYVPEEVLDTFASEQIRSLPMTDWHLHELYDFLPALGVTTIYATWSRFVADLNRPSDNKPLYPGRFETGIVATQTFWGDPVYQDAPDTAEIERRRQLVHKPYHDQLADILEKKIERFGQVVLIDAHSVPSRANLLHDKLVDHIYLGNRDGESCEPWLMNITQTIFEEGGLSVVRNNPYKGGYITAHYGAMERVEALQIEMCQRVYMDESRPGEALASPLFAGTKRLLHGFFEQLCGALQSA